jgi:hypothetical protein
LRLSDENQIKGGMGKPHQGGKHGFNRWR